MVQARNQKHGITVQKSIIEKIDKLESVLSQNNNKHKLKMCVWVYELCVY